MGLRANSTGGSKHLNFGFGLGAQLLGSARVEVSRYAKEAD
jgi:hypothetical protein